MTNVTFTGLVPRDRIPHYLAASDISLVTLKPSEVFKTVLTVALHDITLEERIEKEQRFLADVGLVLATTLDYDVTLARIVENDG